jgi:hypothetical protein
MKKYFNIILFAAAVTGLTSCLKDDKANLTDSNSPAVVEFSTSQTDVPASPSGSTYTLYNRAYEVGTSMDVPFTVNYTGGGIAPTDIKVTIGVNNAAVDQYVKERLDRDRQTVSLTPFPSNFYTLPTNVVIPKGQRKADFVVKLNTSLVTDFAINYVLPISITQADATISGNYGTILAKIAVKNAYDGVYSLKGTIARNSATGPDNSLGGVFQSGLTIAMSTTGQFTNSFSQVWKTGGGIAGIDGTFLTVDPATNKVTVRSSNPSMINIPGYDSRYDPATKTFYLGFKWGTAPSDRVAVDTLTYLRSR